MRLFKEESGKQCRSHQPNHFASIVGLRNNTLEYISYLLCAREQLHSKVLLEFIDAYKIDPIAPISHWLPQLWNGISSM